MLLPFTSFVKICQRGQIHAQGLLKWEKQGAARDAEILYAALQRQRGAPEGRRQS